MSLSSFRSLRVTLIGAMLLVALPACALSEDHDDDDRAPRGLLPSGQVITPMAASGSVFTTLDPGLPDHPRYRAGEAVKTAVSPDGKTLLVMTSGYNNLNYSTGASAGSLEPSASNEYVFVYQLQGRYGAAPRVAQVIQVPNSFVGLAFAPDGKTFYVSGGVDDRVYAYTNPTGSAWSLSSTIALGHVAGIGFEQAPTVAGLALSQSGRLLVAANIYNDSISVIDTTTGTVLVPNYDLRPYNTTPAGGHGIAGGETPFGVAVKDEGIVYVSSIRDREIDVLDISQVTSGGAPMLITRIALPGNPNSLLLSNDAAQSTLFVAQDNSDTVALIDTASNTVREEIGAVAPPGLLLGERYPGAAPNGLAQSPDGGTLYVTEGGSNALAVIAVGPHQPHAVVGLVPTGWYPNSVSVGADGRTLYVVNGKSVPGPNPLNPGDNTGAAPNSANQYVYQLEQGGLLTLPTPSWWDLAELTRTVAANNFWRLQPNREDERVMAALRQRIGHVIYIIKENRTFDQVLGDLGNGSNGDSALALYGRTLTPNFHRLSEQFVTLDNFFCSGEVSGDGWHWSTEGRETDMATKTIPLNYASSPNGGGRGAPYDAEGYNRDIMVGIPTLAGREAAEPLYNLLLSEELGAFGLPGLPSDVLPGSNDDAAADGPGGNVPQQGYIWDAALRAGLAVRNYGFFIDGGRYGTVPPFIPLDPTPFADGVQMAFAMSPDLIGRTDIYFRGFDNAYPDIDREQEWEREFDQFVADGQLPALSLVRLMHDHTGNFGTAIGGINTPELQQADNDYSVGRLIQAVANSPYKSNTLIFVLEDDAQAGPDHVDAHRSTAYVAGPYVRQHRVVSQRYSTVNMLRTIEDILGTDHLNLIDAHQRPMTEIFDLAQKDWTYQAVASSALQGTAAAADRSIRWADAAPFAPRHSAAWWAEQTRGFDFSAEDRVPADLFNRIQWEGVMGTPYPGERSGQDLGGYLAQHAAADGPASR
ncbi:MAG TPA: phosphoesterase [Stellaceae bacterium]|nr:phosphoesterase [Stellaceae bacterium]